MSPEGRRELGELLKQLLEKQRDLPAGALQIIGLEEVHKRLGDRFDALHERILKACRRIIEQHVIQPDLSIELPDEDSWLLIFVETSHGDPQATCKHIREEIARYCLGEMEAAGLRIDLPVVTLAELCAEGSSISELVREAGGEPPPKTPPLKIIPPDIRPRKAATSRSRDAADHMPTSVTGAMGTEIEHMFRPIWDSQTQRVVSNLSLGISRLPGGRWVEDTEALDVPDNWEEVGWLDRANLIHSMTTLSEVLTGDSATFVTVQAHYEAVISYGLRARFTSLLGEIPRHLRRHLFIEITGIPAGAPALNLAQLAATFRPFCAEIYASQAFHAFNPAVYSGSGIKLVGISLHDCKLTLDQLGPELWRMGTALKRAGLAAYVREVHSQRIAAIATQSGFRFQCGTALFADTSVPVPQQPLPQEFIAAIRTTLASSGPA